jgi:hypothetical protein
MPGPGFIPFWVAIIVGILSLIQLYTEIRRKSGKTGKPLFEGKQVRNTVSGLCFLFAFPLLLDKMGFFICTLLFTGACLKVVGKRKWAMVVPVSLAVAVISYMIFVVWLQLQIPQGKWLESVLSLLKDLSWI